MGSCYSGDHISGDHIHRNITTCTCNNAPGKIARKEIIYKLQLMDYDPTGGRTIHHCPYSIGVGRFRILGGQGLKYLGGGGGGGRGGKIPSRHMASYYRRCDVTTSHRRHFDVMCPLGF